MPLEQPILRLTVDLAAATEAHRFVTPAGAMPEAGGPVLGPTYTAGKVGEAVAATALGVAPVTAAEAMAVGAAVASDADGKAVVARDDALHSAVIDGGAVGELTVTGLAAVIHLSKTAALGLSDIADLTSEFGLTAAGTIDNTGGTATTGGKLLVLWSTPHITVGRALSAAATDGDAIQVLMIPN